MKKLIKSFSLMFLMLIMVSVGFGNYIANAASYTAADVAQHATASDCWMILNNSVYGLTNYIPIHPGGTFISSMCGKDGTALFNSGPHPAGTLNVLNSYILGSLFVPVLTNVAISPNTAGIMVGGTQQLTVSTLDQNGSSINSTTTYSSSNNSVATVNNSGLITGVYSGTAVITATSISGGVTKIGISNITVSSPVPTPVLSNILITPTSSSIMVGNTQQLATSASDQNGNPIYANISFSSSNSAVATVSNTGLVKGILSGQATVTATAVNNGVIVKGSSIITIKEIPVLTSIVVSPATFSVASGSQEQLAVSTLDQNNNPIAATLSFSSSGASVATVNSSGLVTGITAGSATITATAVGGAITLSGTSEATVTPAPVLSNVILKPSTSSIMTGGSIQLTHSTLDQKGSPITASLSYSSSDPTIATVSNDGLVAGIRAGSVTVTATAVNGGTTVTGIAEVTVSAPILTRILVTPSTSTIMIGGTQQINVSASDQNGTAMTTTNSFVSSGTTVATISNVGVVTGVKAGVTTITVTSIKGGVTLTGNSTITVSSDVTAPIIKLLGKSPVTITIGSKYTDAGATATDNIDGNITAKIITVNDVNPSMIGTYTVTYNVTDTQGNIAPTITRIVKVVRLSSSGGGSSGGGRVVTTIPSTTTTIEGCVAGYLFNVTNGHPCAVIPGSVLGAEKFNFTLLMKIGSKNGDVKELQKFLNTKGYNSGTVDGKFGLLTQAAIIKFQIANGLKGDGIIGPITRVALNK